MRHRHVLHQQNHKDFFDQSLDEIKILSHVNGLDPDDKFHVVHMLDYFYHREHLFIVFELLRANLFEVKRNDVLKSKAARSEEGSPSSSIHQDFFTEKRIKKVARQVLSALDFLHRRCHVIHADVKPENILVKSFKSCEVKLIDLGSSCFRSDRLSGYVQSRSYRAPEVILGVQYGSPIDIWSLGCVLAELANAKGEVLFVNDDVPCILARMVGILGDMPKWMLESGCYARRYFTRSGLIFNRQEDDAGGTCGTAHLQENGGASDVTHGVGRLEYVIPKATSLSDRVDIAGDLFLDFLKSLLTFDPAQRPTAAEALQHPWLRSADSDDGGASSAG